MTAIHGDIPIKQAFDSNGALVSGAVLRIYQAGTSTPVNVYSDEDFSTSMGAYVTADANGNLPAFYVKGDSKLKLRLETSVSDATLLAPEVDNWSPASSLFIASVDNVAALKALGAGAYKSVQDRNTGRYYRWDGTSTTTANDVTVVEPDAGGTGRWLLIDTDQGAATPEDFGAVGDGTTDDTTAMQAVFAAGGRIVGRPGSTYRTTSTITGVANTDADFQASELYLDATSDTMVQFHGSESGSYVPAGAFAKGSISLPLTDSTDFSENDWIRVGSNAVFDLGRTKTPRGELARVLVNDTSTNTLILSAPLNDDYKTDRLATCAINNAGSSYVVGDEITFSGGGASTNAQVRVVEVDTSGGVEKVAFVTRGAGYTGIPTGWSGGSGSGISFSGFAVEAHFVTRLTMLDKCRFRGNIRGQNTGNTPNNNGAAGVSFRLCTNSYSEVNAEKFDDRAVQYQDCPGFVHGPGEIRDTETTGTGYGVAVANACQNFTVYGLTGIRVRHLTTIVSSTAVSGLARDGLIANCISYDSAPADVSAQDITLSSIDTVNDYLVKVAHGLQGPDRVRIISTGDLPGGVLNKVHYWAKEVDADNVRIYPTRRDAIAGTNYVNLTSSGSGTMTIRSMPGGDAFDTHAACDRIKFANCKSIGASGNGFIAENPGVSYDVCESHRAEVHGFQIANSSDEPGNVSLSNIIANDNDGDGVRIKPGFTAADSEKTTAHALSAQRNAGAGFFVAKGTGLAVCGGGNFTGITCLKNGVTGGQFYLQAVSGFTASSIRAETESTAGNAVQILDCEDWVLHGAQLTLPSSAGGAGVYVNASSSGANTDGVLESIHVKSPSASSSEGVFLSDNATNITIGRSCRMSDCTTQVRKGSGTGHIIDYGVLEGSGSVSGVAVAASDTASETITVTGAALGDYVESVGFSVAMPADLTYSAHVSAANTVTIRYSNPTAGALTGPSGTAYVRVKERW